MQQKQVSVRRTARQRAFQTLYGLHFEAAENQEKLFFLFSKGPSLRGEGKVAQKAGEFAWELVLGVWEHSEELDETISKFSQHWKIKRIAKIELTILRLALFEMLYRPDIPLKVAINEAVEMAKSYGDENSANFINGILDAAAKAVQNGEFEMRKGI
ncbi:MAG: transcription antitermination factor NusB [Desulfovibrio sp.]|uniref:transcription antitermination factor NusB n=1 Tax=Desulfovibrio sp. 7SRBS1 TaxID=3378064 RepID=UPI003B3C99D1